MRTFSKGQSDDDLTFAEYVKHATTNAARIAGPFQVETSEGTMTCKDGYLAYDARGYPYPIAADEFALIYRPI